MGRKYGGNCGLLAVLSQKWRLQKQADVRRTVSSSTSCHARSCQDLCTFVCFRASSVSSGFSHPALELVPTLTSRDAAFTSHVQRSHRRTSERAELKAATAWWQGAFIPNLPPLPGFRPTSLSSCIFINEL